MDNRSSRTAERIALTILVASTVTVAMMYLAFGLATASTTLGCDYGSYSGAASRFLAGEPIYLPGPARTGECPLFPYPPPFVLIMIPFVWLGSAGMWAWIAGAWVSFAVGTAILPVHRGVRLAVFLLGSIGWPLIYGVRIGQVVPLLYLIFAIGWRALRQDTTVGVVAAVGTLIKVQPGLLLVWLLVRRRLRALAAAIVAMVAVTAFAAAIGLNAWTEFVRTIVQISNAVDVPANLAIGASAYRLGVGLDVANAIQTINTFAIVGLVAAAARSLPAVPGYLVVITATQVLTPIVWSHYALIVLLPTAYFLQYRHWWALLIPLCQAWMLVAAVPDVVYPLSLYISIGALFVIGRREVPDRASSRALAVRAAR